MIFRATNVQRWRKQIKAYGNPDLTTHFAISKIANLCPYLLPTRKSEKKTQKISYFLLKSFAVSNKSSTFAVHLGNKDAYLRHRNP